MKLSNYFSEPEHRKIVVAVLRESRLTAHDIIALAYIAANDCVASDPLIVRMTLVDRLEHNKTTYPVDYAGLLDKLRNAPESLMLALSAYLIEIWHKDKGPNYVKIRRDCTPPA